MPAKRLRMPVASSTARHDAAPRRRRLDGRAGAVARRRRRAGCRRAHERLGATGRLPLAVLDQALRVAGELDGAQAEEDEPPLRRDREDAGDPLGAAEDPAEERALEDHRVEEGEGGAGRGPRPRPCATPSVTTSTSQNSAANGAKLLRVVDVLLVDARASPRRGRR